MKKIMLLASGMLLSWNASAMDIAGIKLADRVQMGSMRLQLNGAGVRTRFLFKVYVAALYLPQKQTSGDAIIDDDSERRIELRMLREVTSGKLYETFRDAIEANNSQDILSAIDPQLKQLGQIFTSLESVKPGDVIIIDYQPGAGTQISVNGVAMGTMAGAGFNRALLRIWLGSKPVQEDLKKGMLGG